MFISVRGKRMYLWPAVDREGDVLDTLVRSRRKKAAALKLMRNLLKKQGFAQSTIVSHKLRSDRSAIRDLRLTAEHERGKRNNNGAGDSHQPVRR